MNEQIRERIERIANEATIKWVEGRGELNLDKAFIAALTAFAEEEDKAKTKALKAAVSAIYFADNSDYLGYLWDVVSELDPELAALLEKDEKAAYEQLHPPGE